MDIISLCQSGVCYLQVLQNCNMVNCIVHWKSLRTSHIYREEGNLETYIIRGANFSRGSEIFALTRQSLEKHDQSLPDRLAC